MGKPHHICVLTTPPLTNVFACVCDIGDSLVLMGGLCRIEAQILESTLYSDFI